MKSKDDFFYKYVDSRLDDEIYALTIGCEQCLPTKSVIGPLVRDHCVIHYCVKGEGTYVLGNKTYNIQAGDVFYIPAGIKIMYRPNPTNPWKYYWFEFGGRYAEKLSERAHLTVDNPVWRCTFDLEKEFSEWFSLIDNKCLDVLCTSYIYRILSFIIKKRNPKKSDNASTKETQIKRAINYVEDNYQKSSLCLTNLSRELGLNPSYVSRIFKQTVGIAVSKYIIEYRIKKACELMENTSLNIKSIAYSVGYSDPLYFSKEFKRYKDISPTAYMASVRNQSR